MNLVSLENQSTTVRIELKLLERGRSVMKSMLMSTQGIVLGCSGTAEPVGFVLLPLKRAQWSHQEMYVQTSEASLGQ